MNDRTLEEMKGILTTLHDVYQRLENIIESDGELPNKSGRYED